MVLRRQPLPSALPSPLPATPAGGQQTAMEGLTTLAQLVAEGGSRISVMPGGGLDEENAATVARVTGGWVRAVGLPGSGLRWRAPCVLHRWRRRGQGGF